MRFFSKIFRKQAKKQEEPRQQPEPSERPRGPDISMRRYGRGKCTFLERGPYGAIAKEAAYQAARAHCYVNHDLFRHIMRKNDVPETMIAEYLNSYQLEDDCYLHPGELESPGKLYGRGKCWFSAWGPGAYRDLAAEAFRQSIQIVCRVDQEKFHQIMARAGVPETVIADYLNSYSMVDDELYFGSLY
jgi:hypothetical protein